MALMKDHHQTPSKSFYENMLEVEFPHIPPYEFGDYDHQHQDNDNDNDHGLESPNSIKVNNDHNNNNNNQAISSSSSANSSNSNNNGYNNRDEDNSLINFNNHHSFQIDHENYKIWDEVSHLRASSSDYMDSPNNNEWFYNDPSVVDLSQESTTTTTTQQRCFNKRLHMDDENTHAPKKQCTTSASKKHLKTKVASKSKDPQSVAAKNRRERISEKLKILQDLVPNGSKVDLVTMLEKAIGYVKFLQLQMKVLATDEFWPVAGGKAPDISQVKDAIDAILSSQRPKPSH
ncbi:hypothetical protein vseg_006531 [Gypsophila vaccaria]